jgi:hypothetical protein
MVNLPNLFKYLPSLFNTFNYLDACEANTNKIEKIQERALRFIYNDYNSTYENLLIFSKLPTLKVRRLRTMAIEVYKILHLLNF